MRIKMIGGSPHPSRRPVSTMERFENSRLGPALVLVTVLLVIFLAFYLFYRLHSA